MDCVQIFVYGYISSDLIFLISDIAINTPSVKILFFQNGSTLHFDHISSTLRNCLLTLMEWMSKIHAWIYIPLHSDSLVPSNP